jgi:predicted metalloprotease with PDZ domain
MWRGGLSASNSLFLHSDRPLVSENGTSPLLHELTHMVTRISGASTANTNDDWIAEGLAEFYSFELLYRADGMTKSRRSKIIKNLAKWGAEVKHLRKSKSTGPVTARAVVLLDELDKEIRKRSNNKYSIDDVTRDLMKTRKVSLDDLHNSVEKLIGPKIDALNSSLLK